MGDGVFPVLHVIDSLAFNYFFSLCFYFGLAVIPIAWTIELFRRR